MPSIEELIATEEISKEQAAILEKLQPGCYCEHKSWGYGKVTSLDEVTGVMTVDFERKTGHKLEVLFAIESLTPLADEHIYALRKGRPEEARALAQDNPVELLRIAITSLARRATPEALMAVLTPDPIPLNEWKKWWDSARKAARADGRFTFPAAKTQPIIFTEKAKTSKSLIQTAIQSKGIEQALRALMEISRDTASLRDNKEEAVALLTRVDELLSHKPTTNKTKQDLLKLALARDLLAEELGVQPSDHVRTVMLLGTLESQVPELINSLPAVHQKRLLEVIAEREPETWHAAVVGLLRIAGQRLLTSIRDFLSERKSDHVFNEGIERAVRELNLSSEGLIWIIKNRKNQNSLINPRLFSALIAAIERDQIGDTRSARLHDLVISDRTLLTDLLQNADPVEVRDMTRQLLLASVFDDMNKRSLLARIIKKYPEIESYVTTTPGKSREAAAAESSTAAAQSEGGKLIVSWSSLKRRKDELDELINKKIPANTQEIAIARSYGDLRENSEFKFAKEQQAVLARRRAELEADLMRAEGTDFSNPDTSRVSIGTTVTVSGPYGRETYSILGAWDADPSRNIISYLTATARALMGRSPGDVVELPREDGTTVTLRVDKIEPFNGRLD